MDFIFIANTWNAGRDNPTSKHRIAIELVRRGHKVLWIEGSGMRTPSMGSSHDRLRMARKVVAAFRGVRTESIEFREKNFEQKPAKPAKEENCISAEGGSRNSSSRSSRTSVQISSSFLWVLSPLFIPLPRYEIIRRLNGLICRLCMRFWSWRLDFHDPVLINYVPVLAEAMRGRLGRQTLEVKEGNFEQKAAKSAKPLWQAPSTGLRTGQGREENCITAEGGGINLSLRSSRASVQNSSSVLVDTARVVYHCVDRWDAFSNYDSLMMAEMDKRCCQYADLVIASSQDLVERCYRYNNNVHYLSHGVDHAHFAQALKVKERPADLPSGRVAGFFGLLSEWMDQDLLVAVAKGVPECQLVLIGKADVDISRLKGHPNVHIMGPRPFNQLPAYIAHFDVGLIPFVINELTVAVNPIKLREMLSAGCPVVSTALPEVKGYRGKGVVVATTVDHFVEAVASCLRHPAVLQERTVISAGVAKETWAGKVDDIIVLVTGGE
jgi:hypothetical protein